MDTPFLFWVLFHVAVFSVLAIDLFFFHREARPVTLKEAASWTCAWVTLSLLFNAFIFHWKGRESGMEFLTGYLIEYSLSMDNILVFVVVMGYFRVPAKYQHRVLLWGVLGAFVLRGMMIGLGVALVHRFHWVLYLFGVFLVVTGLKMLFHREEEVELEKNLMLRWCRRLLPISPVYDGERFITRVNGRRMFTPLALVLVFLNFIDLIFAVDSIPAIFAITTDPFIVYTSNICAVLGLRSLYFLLANVIQRFVYLKAGLAIVLAVIGVKMLIEDFWKMPTALSLGLVLGILALSIVASLLSKRKLDVPAPPSGADAFRDSSEPPR